MAIVRLQMSPLEDGLQHFEMATHGFGVQAVVVSEYLDHRNLSKGGVQWVNILIADWPPHILSFPRPSTCPSEQHSSCSRRGGVCSSRSLLSLHSGRSVLQWSHDRRSSPSPTSTATTNAFCPSVTDETRGGRRGGGDSSSAHFPPCSHSNSTQDGDAAGTACAAISIPATQSDHSGKGVRVRVTPSCVHC